MYFFLSMSSFLLEINIYLSIYLSISGSGISGSTQLDNYAVEKIQMTLESAWIYETHHFQLKFASIYRKEVKIIEITYFLATLPIMDTKVAITRYLVIVST